MCIWEDSVNVRNYCFVFISWYLICKLAIVLTTKKAHLDLNKLLKFLTNKKNFNKK